MNEENRTTTTKHEVTFPQDSTLESLLEGVKDPDVIEWIKSDYTIRKGGIEGLFFNARGKILDAFYNPEGGNVELAVDGALASIIGELTTGSIPNCRFVVQEYVANVFKKDDDTLDLVENTRPVPYAVKAYWDLVNS